MVGRQVAGRWGQRPLQARRWVGVPLVAGDLGSVGVGPGVGWRVAGRWGQRPWQARLWVGVLLAAGELGLVGLGSGVGWRVAGRWGQRPRRARLWVGVPLAAGDLGSVGVGAGVGWQVAGRWGQRPLRACLWVGVPLAAGELAPPGLGWPGAAPWRGSAGWRDVPAWVVGVVAGRQAAGHWGQRSLRTPLWAGIAGPGQAFAAGALLVLTGLASEPGSASGPDRVWVVGTLGVGRPAVWAGWRAAAPGPVGLRALGRAGPAAGAGGR